VPAKSTKILNAIVDAFWLECVDTVTYNSEIAELTEKCLATWGSNVDSYSVTSAYAFWLSEIKPPKEVKNDVKRMIGPGWVSLNKDVALLAEDGEDIFEYYADLLEFLASEGPPDKRPDGTYDVMEEMLPGFIDEYMKELE